MKKIIFAAAIVFAATQATHLRSLDQAASLDALATEMGPPGEGVWNENEGYMGGADGAGGGRPDAEKELEEYRAEEAAAEERAAKEAKIAAMKAKAAAMKAKVV